MADVASSYEESRERARWLRARSNELRADVKLLHDRARLACTTAAMLKYLRGYYARRPAHTPTRH